ALLRLFLGGVGDDDPADLLFAFVKALDDEAVVERSDIHGFRLQIDVTAWIGLGRIMQDTWERNASCVRGFDRRMFLSPTLAQVAGAGSADRAGRAARGSTARGADATARSASR